MSTINDVSVTNRVIGPIDRGMVFGNRRPRFGSLIEYSMFEG